MMNIYHVLYIVIISHILGMMIIFFALIWYFDVLFYVYDNNIWCSMYANDILYSICDNNVLWFMIISHVLLSRAHILYMTVISRVLYMILTLTGHGLNLLMISHVLYLIISARKHIETLLMCEILPTNWPPKC